MKLFFSPGACCMSCHIALEKAKLPFEAIYVGNKEDLPVREMFLRINPLGAVPALQTTDGKILTQNIAILEYVADQNPESNLLAPVGTWERSQTMRWLSLVASDLHKSFSPLFHLTKITSNIDAQKDIKTWCFNNITKYLTELEHHLQHSEFLGGEHFTIADCYLFTVYQWAAGVGFKTDDFPALNRYSENIAKLPAVIAVRAREAAVRK